MTDELITVENIGKKFCRNLKRSLWYGVKDIASELIGHGRKIKELRKGEFWAVQDVSFTVQRGETIGLIGRNGAGKTTLLRMLNGLIKPDKGTIHIRGRMQALIALGAGFNPVLTGRENIYVNASVLGIPKKEIDRKLDEIIAFSGIEEFMDTPVQNYSSGMSVRLGFAVAAHLDPDILLVDEVLAVGDEGFQSKCLNKIGELKKNGTAILLVSHNMHTISTYSSSIILINKGVQENYTDISEGIKKYRSAFKGDQEIQKVVSGNNNISFYDVSFSKSVIRPSTNFNIDLYYHSTKTYKNIEVGVAIYSSHEPGQHFQATNKTFNEVIDLLEGNHFLQILLKKIMINGGLGTIALSIWSENRTEQLFWWRIPVEFDSIPLSTGNNFINVEFNTKMQRKI